MRVVLLAGSENARHAYNPGLTWFRARAIIRQVTGKCGQLNNNISRQGLSLRRRRVRSHRLGVGVGLHFQRHGLHDTATHTVFPPFFPHIQSLSTRTTQVAGAGRVGLARGLA